MPFEQNEIKERKLTRSFSGRYKRTLKSSGVTTIGGSGEALFYGRQKTVSQGHPRDRKTGNWLSGGPFYTEKVHLVGNPTRVTLRKETSSVINFAQDVPVLPMTPTQAGMNSPAGPSINLVSPDGVLDQAGATAIARCEPTNSMSDASTFLGELVKDGLPSLPGVQTWERRAAAAKAAGSEFLNAVFGWNPLISEVKSFANVAANAHKVIDQYERDAGRQVRRRYEFPTEVSTSETSPVATVAPFVVGCGSTFTTSGSIAAAWRVTRTVTTKRRWFSGAFTYHLPTGYDSRMKMMDYATRAQVLLGSPLDPEVLWNLAPWSWAVDWFSNAGDVVHNIGAFASNGLVMRYGYIMEEVTKNVTHYHLGPCNLQGMERMEIAPMSVITTTKTRRPANPYGFGVTWEGLSSTQVAILSALGITRS